MEIPVLSAYLPITDPTWIFFHRVMHHPVCPGIARPPEDSAHYRNDYCGCIDRASWLAYSG